MLLKTINAKDGSTEIVTTKKKKKVRELTRPIICICNDPYAPVLRNLRPFAQIMYVKPPDFQTLGKRLFDICQWEGLHADLRAMLVLCELTDGDIRSALNTLQFLGQKTNVISHKTLLQTAGSKDVNKDWMFICNQIFQVPTAVQKKTIAFQKTSAGDSVEKPSAENAFVTRIATFLQSSGDSEKIMQGIYPLTKLALKITSVLKYSILGLNHPPALDLFSKVSTSIFTISCLFMSIENNILN